MMNYKEATDEIKKRREAYVMKKNMRTKKAVTVVCVVLAVTLGGGGAWFVGTQMTDTPDVPEVQTDTGSITTGTESESAVKTNTTIPPDATVNSGSDGGFWFEKKLDLPENFMIKNEEELPDKLMTYKRDIGDRYLVDENYEVGVDKEYYAGAMANLREYVALLYGEENIDDSRFGVYSYNTDDPYIDSVIETDKRPISGFADHIIVKMDITGVEEYREMTMDEAYEYLTNTPYYKAALEFLDIETEWTTRSHYGRMNDVDYYEFTVSEAADDVFTAQTNRYQKYIEMKFELYDDRLFAIFAIYDPCTLVEYSCLDRVPYGEALNAARESLARQGRYPAEDCEIAATVTYNSGEINDESVIAPYYQFYFGYRDENGEFIYDYQSDVPMVRGVSDPFAR